MPIVEFKINEINESELELLNKYARFDGDTLILRRTPKTGYVQYGRLYNQVEGNYTKTYGKVLDENNKLLYIVYCNVAIQDDDTDDIEP